MITELFRIVFEWMKQDFEVGSYHISFWGIFVAGVVISLISELIWLFNDK